MGLHVLVDDTRDFGDIIIRNPDVAVAILRRLHKQIERLSMDNDMGGSISGYKILGQFMMDCRNQSLYPNEVYVVTGNSVAAGYMRATLQQHGYTSPDGYKWVR